MTLDEFWESDGERAERLEDMSVNLAKQSASWQRKYIQQSVHLTALRRWLAVSILVNVVLLVVLLNANC